MRNAPFCATWLLFAFLCSPLQGAPIKDKADPASADFPDLKDVDGILVAHLRVGDIWSALLTKDVLEKVARVKGGPEALLDIEKAFRMYELQGFRSRFGFSLTELQTATLNVSSLSGEFGRPRYALIVTSTKPIVKMSHLLNVDGRGFVHVRETFDGEMLLHFPDNRTAVLLHESLADRYLAGYAKDRAAWPMSKSLLKAAEKNTFVAVVNPDKVPVESRRDLGRDAPALLIAKQLVAAGNWKANEFSLEVRASFHDEISAKKARDLAMKSLGQWSGRVSESLRQKSTLIEMGSAITLLQELQRSIKETKLDLYGPDLVAKAVYKVELPFEKIAVELAERIRIEKIRGPSQLNLHKLAMAIHNYASANGGEQLVVWGTEANGVPVKNLKAKPLLSWRVAMLPYIGEEVLYEQFKQDEPWDSEHNKKLIAKMPKVFAPVNNVKAAEGHTFYQMVIGPKAMRPGVFNIGNITDGTMNTIAVVEAAEPVIWSKPDDVFIPGDKMPKDLKKKFGGLKFEDGFNVLMYDGTVKWVDTRKVSDATLWLAIQPDDQ